MHTCKSFSANLPGKSQLFPWQRFAPVISSPLSASVPLTLFVALPGPNEEEWTFQIKKTS